MDYTKYVLVAQARTGSTYLNALLDSHANTIVFGELFHGDETVRQTSARGCRIATYDDDPVDYLRSIVFKKYPVETAAVGFKLFYNQARNPEWRGLRKYIEQSDIKTIHLKRKNILDIYLSLQLGYRSNKWVQYKGDVQKTAAPINLDPAECLTFLHKFSWRQEREDNFLQGSLVLEMFYEDLINDLPGESSRLQKFLCLTYQELSSNTVKQQARKREEAIANYDELKHHFKQSMAKGRAKAEWLEFFDA